MFNTANRRLSMIRFGRPFVPLLLPPSGSVDTAQCRVDLARYSALLGVVELIPLSAVVLDGHNLLAEALAGHNTVSEVLGGYNIEGRVL